MANMTVPELTNLTKEISKEDEEFCLFWGGTFSQWAKYDMDIDGVKYNCCEQYMMAEKARLFDDQEMLEKIMSLKDPREQKKCGRKVKGFDREKWEAIARDVVYKANYAKFTQNENCLHTLKEQEGKTIVEASPYDKIWGIGLSKDDPRAKDKSQWEGTNWLGEAIMQVRDKLIEEKIIV